jgi:L-threonylcarbamoyladenylate synthase
MSGLSMSLQQAARIIRNGGVVAYPTEGVFGLGCLPQLQEAVRRVLEIKQRDPSPGLVLIAGDSAQLDPFIRLPTGGVPVSDLEYPVTWIVAASDPAPPLIRGRHPGVAVRVTAHPVARALCNAVGSALVSTSANVSGRPPARNAYVLRRDFGHLVDYIVPGRCGPARGPSEIRDLASGKVLRRGG